MYNVSFTTREDLLEFDTTHILKIRHLAWWPVATQTSSQFITLEPCIHKTKVGR